MADDKHDKAMDLTEPALDAMEQGDEAQAKKLADEAKKIDPAAVDEVMQDLENAKRTDTVNDQD